MICVHQIILKILKYRDSFLNDTQYSDSSNDANVFSPYTMSYGKSSSHPSGSIGEYGIINYPYDPQMSFQTPYQMQQGFQTSMKVNP